ncbi:hypothetical protein psyc5s11_21330 [Clostridium gelidum]|uniref:Endonuclease GajA/Old nuclease/RecF-like AAA domain-containing protein n=1 Tax=Clostridium gelidum TaxID=704125 RepID=A0ABM7T2B7_9CLOT|nr:AAA family ATPase [Clostridium gelidum]BCZ46066.1 hypothetical protein psyc5s11_21330 [Clostridium gelidum]
MQEIQLVYFCLLESDTGLNNTELTFSNQFEFSIKKLDKENLRCKVLISRKKTDNITEEFWGKEKHVSRVDLLVGENGAGKTTIMKCLGGRDYTYTKWFAIYKEVVDQNLNWFFDANVDYPFSIEILEGWNIENIIEPKEIYDSSMIAEYIPNALDREFQKIKASSVYKFVKQELDILQKDFPAEKLAYNFNIRVDTNFMVKYLKNEKLNIYLKNILETATCMISKSKEFKLNIRTKEQYGYGEIDEEYIKYRQYVDSLLVECFYKEMFSTERLNLIKMIIYVFWIMYTITNVKNTRVLDFECNVNSLSEFNRYLKRALNHIIKKSKDESNIIKIVRDYIEFDFIEKLFLSVKKGWTKIRIGSTVGIECTILLNKKLNKEIDEKLIEIIDFTQKIESYSNSDDTKLVKLLWVDFCNMSSGEKELIYLFSKIYDILSLNVIKDEEDDFEVELYVQASNYLLLLDEPDLAFHPEWSRKSIYYVTKFINDLLSGTDKKCQLIITTHSPFMVSDMPSDYVTCIKKNTDENKSTYRTIEKPKYSFAANIYELLNDGFFMDAPVGEFAQQKIHEIITRIKALKSFLDKNRNKEIAAISDFINMVSDKLVRARLYDILQKERKDSLDINSPNLIENLIKEIKELKQEVSELKSRSYNGEKL